MKKYLKIMWLAPVILLVFGCSKEYEQDYEKIDVTYFNVTRPVDTTMSIFQLDTLVIDPTITGLKTDGSYSYEWIIFEQGSNSNQVVLSNEKKLKKEITAKVGEYYLSYSVMDNATKVKNLKVYKLSVKGNFYEGWLVTANKDGKGQLSFIREDNVLNLDVLAKVNKKDYPGTAIGSQVYVKGTSKMYDVFYVTNNGITVFDANSLEQTENFNSMFSTAPVITGKVYHDLVNFDYDRALIMNGELRMTTAPVAGLNAVHVGVFSERLEGDYTLFPYVFSRPSGSTSYYYDNKNKRFLSLGFGQRIFGNPTTKVSDVPLINLNAVGKEVLFADYTSSYSTLALMRDANNVMYSANIAFSSGGTLNKITLTALSSTDALTGITAFASSSESAIGFFGIGNNLFKVDSGTGLVTKIYSFAAGQTIADIKMYKRPNRTSFAGTVKPLHNRMLVVATNNGQNGAVNYVYVDGTGLRDTSKPVKTFEGFGKIETLSFRNPN